MTIDEITNFCQFKGCQVSLGSPEAGFVEIDGGGLQRRNNYNRYLSLNELASRPSPVRVLEEASAFTVKRDGQTRRLDRSEFEQELADFNRQLGLK